MELDPTSLRDGIHFSEVVAIDSEHPDKVPHPVPQLAVYSVDIYAQGPVFRFPITIIRPITFSPNEYSKKEEKMDFQPGKIVRRFYDVPAGATFAIVTLEGTHHSPR